MINWDQVEQLKDDLGDDGFQEVVVIFLEEVEDGLAALNQLPETTGQAASEGYHFLKGCAYNLGFDDFAARCAAEETRAQSGETSAADLRAVNRLYEDSKKLFFENRVIPANPAEEDAA